MIRLSLPLEVLVEIHVIILLNILLQEVMLILRTTHPVLLVVVLLAVGLLVVGLLLALLAVHKDPPADGERSLPTTAANS